MAQLTLQTIVDKAARRCGQLAEQLTTEQTKFMRENLGLLLAHEANKGLNLWKVNKLRHQIVPDQLIYTMPTDFEYPLNINYVTGSLETLTPMGVNNNPTTTGLTTCQALSINFATVPSGFIYLEYSDDGTTWTISAQLTISDVGWTHLTAVPVQATNKYWRLRYMVPGFGDLAFPTYVGLYFYSLISEIPMAPLNHDDYWNLPNKDFKGPRPLQYWFDRQNTQSPNLGGQGPQIRYWPVGNDPTVFVSTLYAGRINDPKTLKLDQYIDVPERWMQYIVFSLAADSAYELPNVPDTRIQMLEAKRNELRNEVYDAETDEAPIYWGPNISYYTS